MTISVQFRAIFIVWLISFAVNSYAVDVEQNQADSATTENVLDSGDSLYNAPVVEGYNTGWAFYLDNDAFLPGTIVDRDYTGGVSFTFSGSRASSFLLSIDGWRKGLNQLIGLESLPTKQSSFSLHSFSAGFAAFTPSDQTVSTPIFNDRPYASYLYVANSKEVILPRSGFTYQSMLSVGFLGLKLAGDIQKNVHKLVGSEKPLGWNNQISSGGEPAIKYTLAAQKLIVQSQVSEHTKHEFKFTTEANVGFITNASLGFKWRWGIINTPWWSFIPHLTDYINMGIPIVKETSPGREMYFFVGGDAQYLVYNALLQGQFRDSAVTFNSDEIHSVITEYTIGVAMELANDLRLSIFQRSRDSELKLDNIPRHRWVGISVTQSY